MATITALYTHDMIMGTGALAFPWYRVDHFPAEPGDDANTWTLTFTEFDVDYGSFEVERNPHTITHEDVMRAVRKIASKDGEELVNSSVRSECQALVFKGADAADFDANKADVVLQIAAFGKVIYG